MAISYVQPVAAAVPATGAASYTFPVGQNNGTAISGFVPLTVGNRIILAITCPNGVTVSSIIDSQSNTYSIDIQTAGTNQNAGLFSAYITAALGSSDTITLTLSATAKPEVAAAEYSGIATTSFVTATNSATSGAATGTTTGNKGVTPVNATDQLMSSVGTASTTATGVSDGNGLYTQRVWSGSNALLDDLNNSGTAVVTGIFNWTGSGKWAWAGAAYKMSPTVTGQASMSATASLTATGVAISASASLSATATLTATGRLSGTVHGTAAMSATATLTAVNPGVPLTGGLIPELGTLGAELGAVIASATTVVWVPTGLVMQNPAPTAALSNPAPTAALKDPAPTAALNSYVTNVTLDG